MKGLNLSEWALKHQSLTQFFIVVVAVFGLFSYRHLGQAEDPSFTFRTMVVWVVWPGASTREIEQQVTDRIERKLQETPGLDNLISYSAPGESTIIVNLRDDVNPRKVADAWYQVRKKTEDVKLTLPSGVIGPFFNDEFGDTFGNVYAFTADGFSYAEMKDYVDAARQTMLKVPDVSKVEVLGVQDEKIYVEVAPSKIAMLGIDPGLIMGALQAQNVLMPAGFVNTGTDRVHLRLTGEFSNLESIRNIGITAQGRVFRLGDIAKVYRGYSDPADPRMRFNGKPALGLAISMQKGGNIIALGENLEKSIAEVRKSLPVGIEIGKIHDQPSVVKTSINEFVKTLADPMLPQGILKASKHHTTQPQHQQQQPQHPHNYHNQKHHTTNTLHSA
ncbi:MAG: efflux RND transporter permease subunit, partial [Burkholderiales bacterium]